MTLPLCFNTSCCDIGVNCVIKRLTSKINARNPRIRIVRLDFNQGSIRCLFTENPKDRSIKIDFTFVWSLLIDLAVLFIVYFQLNSKCRRLSIHPCPCFTSRLFLLDFNPCSFNLVIDLSFSELIVVFLHISIRRMSQEVDVKTTIRRSPFMSRMFA